MKRLSSLVLLFLLFMAACSPQATATLVPATSVPVTEVPPTETPPKEIPPTEIPPTETPPTEMPPTEIPPTEAPPDETADTSITIVDALDREVVLPAAPQRIVITGKALFMIIDAAYSFPGAMERVIATGSTQQGSENFIELIDPDYAEKAILESGTGAEQIAPLQPDLVILKSYLADSQGAPIEALGIPVIYVDFETPEQYDRDLAIFGQIFDDTDRAVEIAAMYRERVDSIKETVSAAEKPSVLLLYYNNKDGNVAFNVPPMSWIQTQLVNIAGGDPVWEDANPGSGWTQVTLEQIAAWDADQIFIISYFSSSDEVVEGLEADPNWQEIRAVKDDNLYAFPIDFYSWDQPDPRWYLGLGWLAGKIHPDLFPSLDVIAEAQDFYQTLYGLDTAFFEQNIQPVMKGDF
jgi:iron complex transport system substrate-binding protein